MLLVCATRYPPAEKPMTPIFPGLSLSSLAFDRTSLMVLCASCSARYFWRNPALAFVIPVIVPSRDAVFEQHAGDTPRRQPVADFRAFQVDCKHPEASTRKYDDSRPSVRALRRIHGHRWLADVINLHPSAVPCCRDYRLRLLGGYCIRYRTGPDGNLCLPRLWLPSLSLRRNQADQ